MNIGFILTIAVSLLVVFLALLITRRIDYKAIPANQQRYSTTGDYWIDSKGWHFRVTRLPDRRYEWLVLIHELTELALCQLSQITIAQIDAFDTDYEKQRANGVKGLYEDPGDDVRAPYHRQHQVASAVERTLAVALCVNWTKYQEALDALYD